MRTENYPIPTTYHQRDKLYSDGELFSSPLANDAKNPQLYPPTRYEPTEPRRLSTEVPTFTPRISQLQDQLVD